jgi:hypothetical protein
MICPTEITISNQNMTLNDASKIIGNKYGRIKMYRHNKDSITVNDTMYDSVVALRHAKWNIIDEYLRLKGNRFSNVIYANSNVTLEKIKDSKLLAENIDYIYLSYNNNVTIQYFLANKDKPWNRFILSINLGITLEDIHETDILKNENIIGREDLTISFLDTLKISKTSDILSNPSFSFADAKILAYKNNLNLSKFSSNPNLTFEIVRDNPEIKWDWNEIFQNKFEKDPRFDIAQNCRKQRANTYNSIINEIISNTNLIPPLVKIIVEYVMFI